MHVVVDRESPVPIYLQIAQQLRQSILDGEPPTGGRLPPERRLANLLGVNRTTVVNAYRELAADGLVSGQVGRGTVVIYGQSEEAAEIVSLNAWSRPPAPASATDPRHSGRAATGYDSDRLRSSTANGHSQGNGRRHDLRDAIEEVPPVLAYSPPDGLDRLLQSAPTFEGVYQQPRTAPLPWAQMFTSVTDVMSDPLLRDAMTASARPDVIRLSSGIPSPELYPIDTIRSIFNEALGDTGQLLLQHTPTEGLPQLREQLALWMEGQAQAGGAGGRVDPGQVVVVAGSQQGLYLLARTLIEPGDLVAVESPTYLGAAQVFRAAGARLLPIPVDHDGMQVDLLQEILPRRRPKIIYTLPTFQNPSGAVMSMGRRLRLLDLAARYQIPVIEDDPYGALRYEARPLPTLAAIDRAEGRQNVIYLSTVSKMLFPGFRIGWVSAAKQVTERVTLMKQLVDLDTNALAQRAVYSFFERGHIFPHLETVNRIYPERRDRMLEALQRYCGPLLTAGRPGGGMYLWCRLSEGLRARDLLPEAAREGVMFAPGESFHVDAASGRGRFDFRLNFTLPNDAQIDEGMRRLGIAIRRLAEQHDVLSRSAPTNHLTPIV